MKYTLYTSHLCSHAYLKQFINLIYQGLFVMSVMLIGFLPKSFRYTDGQKFFKSKTNFRNLSCLYKPFNEGIYFFQRKTGLVFGFHLKLFYQLFPIQRFTGIYSRIVRLFSDETFAFPVNYDAINTDIFSKKSLLLSGVLMLLFPVLYVVFSWSLQKILYLFFVERWHGFV